MAKSDLPIISLGFVVRRCTLALGHPPSPRELRQWANTGGENGGAVFGRAITDQDAEVILRHLGRPVHARSAQPHEVASAGDLPVEYQASADVRDKVVDLRAVRARRRSASAQR
jgi:hypothetical protein